jgi:transposase
LATQKLCCRLKFCDGHVVDVPVTRGDLHAEIERLRLELAKRDAAIVERDARIADRDAQIARLAQDIAVLQKAVQHLMAQRRGGLRVPEGQGLLFPESAASSVAADASCDDAAPAGGDESGNDEHDDRPTGQQRAKGTKRAPGKIDTTGLPRQREIHDLPEEQRVDPVSGKALVCIGERVTEELDYQRGRLQVIERVQLLYGLPADEAEHRELAPKMAPLPPKPFENCIATAMLLAWILVQKYCNHLPLYRQQRIFERDGKRLSRKTQCDWTLASAELLAPIVDCLMGKIRAGPARPTKPALPVMQLDDTPVKCQGGRGEPNFQARLWTFVNPEVSGVVYRFTPGRDSASLADLLGNFEGWLVGDGYDGNRAAANKAVKANEMSAGIRIGGCWAHVNRKFRDAAKEAPGTARLFRDAIKKLYEIEREADEAMLSPEARAELRQRRSKPVLIDIYMHAWRLGGQFSDAGSMAKAIGYLRNQHRALRRFLEDGRIPIDNNGAHAARGMSTVMPRPRLCRVRAGRCGKRGGIVILLGLGVGIVRGSRGTRASGLSVGIAQGRSRKDRHAQALVLSAACRRGGRSASSRLTRAQARVRSRFDRPLGAGESSPSCGAACAA